MMLVRFSVGRRLCLAALLSFSFTLPVRADDGLKAAFQRLEKKFDGQIGVMAIDTGSGKRIANREHERFPMCSSFKMVLAAAVLNKSITTPSLMQKEIPVTEADMAPHAPITSKQIGKTVSVDTLCDAIVRFSDNPAANLLLKEIGGPAAVTAYARSLGDKDYRSDRMETVLNSAVPGDPRDTTTPAAMAATMQALVLGKALPPAQQEKLKDWMLHNTTGDEKIRAGVPAGWQVAEKTGNCGRYGASNDIGVLYPPGRAPIVLIVYTRRPKLEHEGSNEIIAEVARLVVDKL